ncbi:MAG: carboxypeptidase regulatory-like domain-containing protein [Anaerolineae bacterium]|nr:carboxypeptidase regulatory-like domain-containing protein [Anaerolineae bacterium]
MKLEDSPQLDDMSGEIFPHSGEAKPEKKSPARMLLALLGLTLIALATYNFFASGTAATLMRKGAISGYIMDESNAPLTARVIIFGTSVRGESNADGFFYIDDVPAGEQSVIVIFGEIGIEVTAQIDPGSETDLGNIQIPTDLDLE